MNIRTGQYLYKQKKCAGCDPKVSKDCWPNKGVAKPACVLKPTIAEHLILDGTSGHHSKVHNISNVLDSMGLVIVPTVDSKSFVLTAKKEVA